MRAIALPQCLAPRIARRGFSATTCRALIKDIRDLPDRTVPSYLDTPSNDLLSLTWPSPPRNVLLVKKSGVPSITDSLIELAKHLTSTYPSISIILEPDVASQIHTRLPFPVYSAAATTLDDPSTPLHTKIDLTATLGGDGTILHASSLFSSTSSVPPILSFSMGTLGFLGEWKFHEHARAFRQLYSSSAFPPSSHSSTSSSSSSNNNSTARVLLRNRLKVSLSSPSSSSSSSSPSSPSSSPRSTTTTHPAIHAMNEIIIHRGASPHLAVVEVSVGGRFLTEAVADGMIISTPTGSTAYSLSSGGSIVHPLVSSLLLTPICPRSLSFRPLVLPANAVVTLKMSGKNRGAGMEVSVDGRRRSEGVGVGMEVRVWGEEIRSEKTGWGGGVPCVMRGGESGDEGWVGGLNGLLKFNYPFGDEG